MHLGLPLPTLSQDLDAYAALYAGHTKHKRLKFIADHAPLLAIEALR